MANVQELENFIDGRFEACSRHVDSYNPATGEVHLKVPDSGEEEVNLAVEAAKRAFKKWVEIKVNVMSMLNGVRVDESYRLDSVNMSSLFAPSLTVSLAPLQMVEDSCSRESPSDEQDR